MAVESLILGAIIAALTVLIVFWPFMMAQAKDKRSNNSELEVLVEQRDAIYTAIRDLDFDYETGKLEDDDYHLQRETWVQRGVEVLKALDVLQPAAGNGYAPAPETDLDVQIEAAISSRRHTT